MQIALDRFGARIEAAPGVCAVCPSCTTEVVPKCGEILVWHFAHKARLDCDDWGEGESAWHAAWKALWPIECREIVVGCHRADIRIEDGCVVELQHSPLSDDEIADRENHYGTMVWIFDATLAHESGRLVLRREGDDITFRWARAPATFRAFRRPVFLDLGEGTLLDVRHFDEARDRGWGRFVTTAEILRRFPAKKPTIAREPSLFGAPA